MEELEAVKEAERAAAAAKADCDERIRMLMKEVKERQKQQARS